MNDLELMVSLLGNLLHVYKLREGYKGQFDIYHHEGDGWNPSATTNGILKIQIEGNSYLF